MDTGIMLSLLKCELEISNILLNLFLSITTLLLNSQLLCNSKS